MPLRTGIPALPFCHVTLKATKPRKDYPRELNTLGDHLRRKRREYGLFAKTVAQKLGCIQPPWVTGRTGAPLLLSTSCSASSVFWATDPICPGGVLGASGRYGSIAIIERLWRTLKDGLRLRSFKPLTNRELERRLELGLYYYTYLRPHQGLGGATPAEIHFGRPPAHLTAVHPPRARPREGPHSCPFEIDYVDTDKMLPVLIRRAA